MFTVTEPPKTDDAKLIAAWAVGELRKVQNALNAIDRLSFVISATLPDKFSNGDVFYFAANVVGGGQPAGLYERAAGAWVKL